jgi:hypothetical protein
MENMIKKSKVRKREIYNKDCNEEEAVVTSGEG